MAAMIHVLCGHRGVGKTSLLRRIEHYASNCGQPVETIDLDQLIEQGEGLTIPVIFERYGEKHFRDLEFKYWQKVSQTKSEVWVAVGAGFDLDLCVGSDIWWIRRITDSEGRIFLDRPSLDKDKSAMDEFLSRAKTREEKFTRLAQHQYVMREGWQLISDFEAIMMGFKSQALGGVVTLAPRANSAELAQQVTELQRLGPQAIELRDDLIDKGEIEEVLHARPSAAYLYSYRRQGGELLKRPWSMVDWALELGPPPRELEIHIQSIHQRENSLKMTFDRFAEAHLAIQKLAVEIESFEELEQGHLWWRENPEKRAFLPRSKNGRWRWYREVFGPQMPLHFWAASDRSALDQPWAFDVLRRRGLDRGFAAVLGWPVDHSWTPAEHHEYFSSRGIYVTQIPMHEEECNAQNIEILRAMGLVAAAVTSPLKRRVLDWAEPTKRVQDLLVANTIVVQDGRWFCENTDIEGLKALAQDVAGSVAVWGGGGMAPILRQVFSTADFYSARTATPRGSVSGKSPETLIWASSAKPNDIKVWPPDLWHPRHVVDLNYFENSAGREYALRVGARYMSGEKMFRAQAAEQRKFWDMYFT